MARAILSAGLLLLATGCAHDRVPRGGETITYAAGPCLGRCPVYSVTLGPDGQGIFTGERFTAVTGDRRFQASPDAVGVFTRALAGLRPRGERLIEPGRKGCGDAATDQPTYDVTWQGADRQPAHLRVYAGCGHRKARAVTTKLRELPARLLPLQPFLQVD